MDYHETRLPYDRRRDVLWRTLCESYFRRLVGPDACVLDSGPATATSSITSGARGE